MNSTTNTAGSFFQDSHNFRYEIPWCPTCHDWHFPGGHTRIPPDQGGNARNRGRGPRSGAYPPPTDARARLDMALKVLRLEPDAMVAQARAAFRSAIHRTHPDHGGDPEEAKKVLAARDVLRELGRL